MKINDQKHFGSDFITFDNENGFVVTLSSIGAGIVDITYLNTKVISRPKDYQIYLGNNGGYYGKTIGPIAGRVKNGIILVGGKENKLDLNEGNNSLHSGSICFAFAPFLYQIKEEKDCFIIVFSYLFKGKKEKFEADIDAKISYKIFKDKPILEYYYELVPNLDCPVNITNHSYFNLNGKGNILSHFLELKSSKVVIYDEELIPKQIKDVDKVFDFRNKKKIGEDILNKELGEKRLNQGYDHCFILDENDYAIPKAILEGEKIGLKLFTTSSALQIYTSAFPHFNLLLNNDEFETKYSSLTLEEVNVSLSLSSMITRKNDKFIRKHKYEFYRKEE
ncbi:MAG TPA: hypothetical protein DD377_00915 [Firmicutes bacterium]|nr:hypothetical protein [Bacillota bacterium]